MIKKNNTISKIQYTGVIWPIYLKVCEVYKSKGEKKIPVLFLHQEEEQTFVKHLINCLKKYPCNDIVILEEKFHEMREIYSTNSDEEIKLYYKYLVIIEEILNESYLYALNNTSASSITLDILLEGLIVLTNHNIPYEEINNIVIGIIVGMKRINSENNNLRKKYADFDYTLNNNTNSKIN